MHVLHFIMIYSLCLVLYCVSFLLMHVLHFIMIYSLCLVLYCVSFLFTGRLGE
jgi:hypothetical protein